MREQREPRRSKTSGSKRVIFRRTVLLMGLCGVLLFIPLLHQLWDISIVRHEDYQQKATGQQTLDLSVSAARGNIYDQKGNVLAMSSTVYTLVLSPKDLVKSVPEKEYRTDGELDQAAYDKAVADKQEKLIYDLMRLVPDLDEEALTKSVNATKYAYRELKTDIEKAEADQIRTYITENKTSSYLYLISGTKRYYPYASLAAQALGFVNSEGGAYGIEAAYNDELEGTAGRVVTTKTATGTEMYNSYSEFIDAIDGYDLNLTIDATIQSYAEKTLEKGIQAYDVQNGGFCIVMNPKTGAILAIASSPDFDPNHYSEILSSELQAQIASDTSSNYEKLKKKNADATGDDRLPDEELMSQAKSEAYSAAWLSQWRSKAINDRYEPGSTFKALVLAAGLEEGVISESDTFNCTGSYKVAGWDRPINCSKRTGHGHETLAQAVQNSCNPAFIQIGQRLGIDKYYDYFEAFGLKEQTGIDLPGEASAAGNIWDRDKMSGVDLAVASFGQRIEVTPIQMITAFAAVINGGKLMQPYVVQSVTTKDGTVVRNTESTVVRQVVSEKTSETATKILESVVGAPTGTGKNAYQAGYRIGGKTGSSEVKTEEGRTIVSFMGFAPADDPEVIVLLAYDKPKEASPGSHYCTTGVYISGGNMAAPQAGALIADILDYLGVEKKYSADESAAVDVSVPDVTGQTEANAALTLNKKHLSYRTVGQGDTVNRQIPAAGTSIPGGSNVILYLGDAVPEETGTVPNVSGLSYDAAKKRLESAGFFMKAAGVSVYYSNTTRATSQSIAAGEAAAIGTVVEVQFSNVVEDGAT